MKECDLIMKGDITSGVVYPKVITELSSEYKFNRVGSTEDIQKQCLSAKPQSMQEFLEQYIEGFNKGAPVATNYKPDDVERMELKTRLAALLMLATSWSSRPIPGSCGRRGMPKPSTSLKHIGEVCALSN